MSDPNAKCKKCGELLTDGFCENSDCSRTFSDGFLPATHELEPTMDSASAEAHDFDFQTLVAKSLEVDDADWVVDNFADPPPATSGGNGARNVTQRVDEGYYEEVYGLFDENPGEDEFSPSDPRIDATQTLSLKGVRSEFVFEGLIPPIRDIRFPTDSASLKSLLKSNPDSLASSEYELTNKLGEGGYGIVFEVQQKALGRPVAVKVLKMKKPQHGSRSGSRSGSGSGAMQRRQKQFLHEAKVTARLEHPNIVPVHEFGVNNNGDLFYTMKKLSQKSKSWDKLIHNTAALLDIPRSDLDEESELKAINTNVEIFSKVCDAMAYAHDEGVVHRDLKPENIMIGEYGEVLLIDFGMALDFSEGRPQFNAGGTIAYMAPEMAEHFIKQREIFSLATKTAGKLGIERGSEFIDQSNLVGFVHLAKELVDNSDDPQVVEYAKRLIDLDVEEKELAERIGKCSDIYLLGAILFEIAAGNPPHYYQIRASERKGNERQKLLTMRTARELTLASKNLIKQYHDVKDPLNISLKSIAMKAMAKDPKDRFQTVQEFQEAIVGFQAQVQSLEMTEAGKVQLQKSRRDKEGLQHLLPALESFRGARTLWNENKEARTQQVRAACMYGERAAKTGNFDAGLEVLSEYVDDDAQEARKVVAVRKELEEGKRKRKRNQRLAWLASLAAIVLPVLVFLFFSSKAIKASRDLAEAEKQKIAAEDLAEKAEKDLETANDAKIVAEGLAEKAREQYLEAEKEIEKTKFQISEGKFTNEISSIPNDIRDNEIAAAKSRLVALSDLPPAFKNGWLSHHYAYLLNVNVEVAKIGANKEDNINQFEIVQLLRLGDEAIAIGNSVDGKSVYRWKSGDQPAKVDVDLPDEGEIISAGVDQAGRFLAIGLDTDQDPSGLANLVVVDLTSGQRIQNTEETDFVTATHNLQFVGSQIFAIEEVDGHKGLKDRLQLSTWQVSGNSLQRTGEPIAINATTRDEGRLDFVLSDIRVDSGTAIAAVSYPTLIAKAEGNAKSRFVTMKKMEVITCSIGQGGGLQKTGTNEIELTELPSAVHLHTSDRLFCGFGDGRMAEYRVRDLSAGLNRLWKSSNQNENRINHIVSTRDGQMVTGSENGAMVLWDTSEAAPKFVKRLGQDSQLAAMAIGRTDTETGFGLYTAGKDGGVRYWMPQTSKHDPQIVKDDSNLNSNIRIDELQITCSAVDANPKNLDVPGVAFGTRSGTVYYFDSDEMRRRSKVDPLTSPGTAQNKLGEFKLSAPFEKFNFVYNDFDGMGIVADRFCVLKKDGTFIHTRIDSDTKAPSADYATFEFAKPGQSVVQGFNPIVTAHQELNYFFSTDPTNHSKLLAWRLRGRKLTAIPVSLNSYEEDTTSQIKMSPDGRWLVVVRFNRRNGNHTTEIYSIASNQTLTLVKRSRPYPAADPAFIGFSSDSAQFAYHYHGRGIDKDTFLKKWTLDGSLWSGSAPIMVRSRKDGLVGWNTASNSNRIVSKFNGKFYLSGETDLGSGQRSQVRSFLEQSTSESSLAKQVAVYPVGTTNDPNGYYVLTKDRISKFEETKPAEDAKFQLKNARGMRVFGSQAVVLDDDGFHLIDSELQYVTKLASRNIAIQSLSLSGKRLAVSYDLSIPEGMVELGDPVNLPIGTCDIYDVSSRNETPLGSINQCRYASISPNSKWVACLVKDELQVFDISGEFRQPIFTKAVSNMTGIDWLGETDCDLLVLDPKAANPWARVSPTEGKALDNPGMELPGIDELQLGDSPVRIGLAAKTNRYLHVSSQDQISLWAIVTPNMQKEDGAKLKDGKAVRIVDGLEIADGSEIRSVDFSEIREEDWTEDDIGTRFVALTEKDGKVSKQIFLLASERKVVTEQNVGLPAQSPFEGEDTNDVAEVEQEKTERVEYTHRIVEIDGALDRSEDEGRTFLDLEFSGDGRTLLQTDREGVTALLSK